MSRMGMGRGGYLTEEELQRVLKFQTDNATQAHVRDLFLFAAFTGLSYADVKALRWDNVRTLFEGQRWIVTRRRKTHTPSNLLLLDIPEQILDRRGDPDAARIFKMPSNNCCNDYLVEMGRQCGIATRITFHIARHTFATLSLSKGVPIETLSSILGHTSIRTTQIYAKMESHQTLIVQTSRAVFHISSVMSAPGTSLPIACRLTLL